MEFENRRYTDHNKTHNVEGLNLLDILGSESKSGGGTGRSTDLFATGKAIVDDFAIVGETTARDFSKIGKSIAQGAVEGCGSISNEFEEYAKTFVEGAANACKREIASGEKFTNDLVGVGKMLANDFKTHGPVLAEHVKTQVEKSPLIVPAAIAAGTLVGVAVVADTPLLVGPSIVGTACAAGAVAFSGLATAFESITGNTKNPYLSNSSTRKE